MSLSAGPNLGLLVNAAQGDAFYSEFLRLLRGLDALVQCSVLDVVAGPPASPNDGDRYLVAATGAGAFSGHGNTIARWSAVAGTWEFFQPLSGWECNVVSQNTKLRYSGSAWVVDVARSSGWTALTGTPNRGTFDTGSATVAQVAQTLKALIDDLIAQGRLTA